MKPIEIRLDLDSVLPLLEHIEPILDLLQDDLAAPGLPPEEDELVKDFWKSDLLDRQRGEIDLIRSIFGEEFRETGRAFFDIEHMDTIIRACSAIRLKLREVSLKEVGDSSLEQGEVDLANLGRDERVGYAAYVLFASLQELAISQLEGGTLDEGEGAN